MNPPHTITVNKSERSYPAAESTKDPDLSVVCEVNRAVRGPPGHDMGDFAAPSRSGRHLGGSGL